MVKVKVKVKRIHEIDRETDGSGEPCIINFEHGQVNPSAIINGLVSKNLSATMYESTNIIKTTTRVNTSNKLNHRSTTTTTANNSNNNSTKSNKKRRAVIIESPGMIYAGSSDNTLNNDSAIKGHNSLRTYIGIRRGKKLNIIEAHSLIVSPTLPPHSHLQVKPTDRSIKTPAEKREAAIDLVKAFGSKKKRLTYERLEKQQTDSQHTNVSMNTATASALMPESHEMPDSKETGIIELVPPCNRTTSDLHQVYNLHDILTPADLEDLTDAAEAWLSCSVVQLQTWRNNKTFSDYFFEMWKLLSSKTKQAEQGRDRTLLKAKMVLYTELLICLLKLKFAEVRKKSPSLPKEFPPWLVQKALDSFTSMNANNLRCRSEQHKDKTCCYIMVLVILSNDFIFDVQLMSTSLQIHIKKLLTLARAVGITVQHNPTTKQYKGLLKLPMPAQIQRRGRIGAFKK